MNLRLYFDDDSQQGAVIRGLQREGINCLTSAGASMEGSDDATHLDFARAAGRVLVSSNIRDFTAISRNWL